MQPKVSILHTAINLLVLVFLLGCNKPVENTQKSVGPLPQPQQVGQQNQRLEVIFWHFWGGRDRAVVEDVIHRFNKSQSEYQVRGIAMPGANLDLKFFLAVAGGNPPDLMNHDDPIVADWANRDALIPLDEVALEEEIEAVRRWLYPAAERLGSYNDRLYALVNGLDVRALYYNASMLEEAGLEPPKTLKDLDAIAETFNVTDQGKLTKVGYLPDTRRLWAWAIVHGGRFYDADQDEPITLDSEANLAALKWMAGYAERLGSDQISTFRTGDQALTGTSFPLLANRRYAAIMDGQWRVRDIREAKFQAAEANTKIDRYGVVPLPSPENGLSDAGWINGNFFIIPRGANQPQGAWEFMKFWVGLDGNEEQAAKTCATGGWIPVSQAVASTETFQGFLNENPLFAEFVRLAASPNQYPTPVIPAAPYYLREVNSAVQDVMYRGAEPEKRLQKATNRVRLQYGRTVESDSNT